MRRNGRTLSPALAVAACPALALALAACGQRSADDAAAPAAAEASAPAAAATSADARPAVFAQCAACHAVEPGKNGIGPSLAGVFGRKAGQAPGFAYSEANLHSGLTWDEPTLDRYLAAPMKVVPGTRMTYAGLADPARRHEIIAYLKTLR